MMTGRLLDVAKQKSVLPAAIVRAIETLQKVGLGNLSPGRHEIEGEMMFYTVEDVALRTVDESRAEAHAQHADIQIPLSARERYGFSLPQPDLVATEDQLEAKDLAFYPDPANESFVEVWPGSYIVFLPGELHRPCLVVGDNTTLRKVVVKVHRSLLGL